MQKNENVQKKTDLGALCIKVVICMYFFTGDRYTGTGELTGKQLPVSYTSTKNGLTGTPVSPVWALLH